jgi:hypothetical protein
VDLSVNSLRYTVEDEFYDQRVSIDGRYNSIIIIASYFNTVTVELYRIIMLCVHV